MTGGSVLRPDEVTLAHHGVLLVDELSEFCRDVLKVLRQPLEDGVITVARVQSTVTFPARFMVVAAMHPCPGRYQRYHTYEPTARGSPTSRGGNVRVRRAREGRQCDGGTPVQADASLMTGELDN